MKQKVIIITGASRGLGEATARWLHQAGVAVVLVARSRKRLNGIAASIDPTGERTLAIAADVAETNNGERIVSQTMKHFGRLDAIVNNAGVLEPLGYIHQADPVAWRYNLDVNLLGPLYLVRAALAELRDRSGRVINVSSGAATTAIEGAGAYCTAKAGLNHLTRVLAAEEPDITAIAVRPGVIDTHMQKTLRNPNARAIATKWTDYYKDLKVEGKLEPPEIPGRVIAWLALNAPPVLSGQFINYDDPNIAIPAIDFFQDHA